MEYGDEVVERIKAGCIGVIPTDTIYGIVCSALQLDSVEKIYSLKQRSSHKPVIVLISSISDLKLFDISVEEGSLESYWPGPTSIILSCPNEKFSYIHRGTDSIAFRLPDNGDLLNLLSKTGPIVAPSANPENLPPALDVNEAREYFKDNVDFYINGGVLESKPSTVIRITGNNIEVLRK